MLRPVSLVLSLLCLIWNSSIAQELHFRRITVDEGLPFNTVSTITQDSLGFIWLGTPAGLARFDGYQVKVFKNDPADSNSLCYDGIRALTAGKNGEVWIGTRVGLSRYIPRLGHFKNMAADSTEANSLSAENISCLLFVRDKLWIGTLGGGINILDTATGKITHLREKTIPSDFIRGLSIDPSGNIWVSFLAHGVACLDPTGKLLSRITVNDGLNSNDTRNIFVDSKGNVWISCWNAGMNVYVPNEKKIYSNKDPEVWTHKIKYSLITSFLEDRAGRIWMATAEHGPGCWDPETQTTTYFESEPDDPHSMSDKTTFSFLEDHSGQIWIGTWHGGVNIYDPKAHVIKHYKASAKDSGSISSNVVWRFTERKAGGIYIGTSRSLNLFQPKTGLAEQVLTAKEGTPDVPTENTIIQAILESDHGDLWLGGNGSGVYYWDEDHKKFTIYGAYGQPGQLPYHTSYWILKDRKGDLWFSTIGGGIAKFNPESKSFTTYAQEDADTNTIISSSVIYMLERKDGRFWLATPAGLDLFNPETGKAIHYRSNPLDSTTLPDKGVNTFVYGSDGRLWIGTGSGLCSFSESDQYFTRYSSDKNGVGDAEIMGLVEDNEGQLWITTNKGLYVMDIHSHTCRMLEPADGIQSKQFILNSIYKDSKGLIYVGGVNGFNVIDPKLVKPNGTPAPVVFTRLTVLNEEVSLSKQISVIPEIEISYYDYFFSLEFAAMEFSDPSRNRYKYFLEGFTEDWVELGTTHFVTFTNLSPGRYVLKVKACNNHGIWNEKSTDLVIVIPPPFYMTWWFYTLCALLAIGGIWYYIRWRERKLQEEKNRLEQVVSIRTRELREEKEKVDAAHKDIKDSINYAKRIQEATLPVAAELRKSLDDSFILFMPRDVVSGDFYWFQEKGDELFIAAADCTGHGVPGALMSMIGSSLMAQIVNEKNIHSPGMILSKLNEDLRLALKQHLADSETRDGMDIALVKLNMKTREMKYSGANRPLYIIRKNIPEIEEIRASKFPIGGSGNEVKHFEEHTIQLSPGDTFFIFSDGYPDQFGGGTGKKFMTKNFKRLLMLYHSQSMADMYRLLHQEFETWRGEFEQVDDVLVIGGRV